MGPVSLRVRYRPLKIGWCIEADSLDDFDKAVSFSHAFWGGRFCPIIPCSDRELAKGLIRSFNLDALYNISGTPGVDAFIKEFPHIQWPDFNAELFQESFGRKRPVLLDVGHPAQHLFETHVDRREKPALDAAFYRWDDTDPLRFILQATCGSYPSADITGRDYAYSFQKAFIAEPLLIGINDPLPADLFRKFTPNWLTTIELEPAAPDFTHWSEPGFYYGDALDFTDLVNFWNLRACNIDLVFYDPRRAERCRLLMQSYGALLRGRPQRDNWPNDISIWQKDWEYGGNLTEFGDKISVCTFDRGLLNGLNLNPPTMSFREKSVLGASSEDGLGVSVTFQLPEKPFFSGSELHSQLMVVSVFTRNLGKARIAPPFVPQMNEYYGRNIHFMYNRARAELGSIGLIENATNDQLTLRAVSFNDVIARLFQTFGVSVKLGPAGLVSSRLIDQMGGIQACRVFKIAGVRALIKKYKPSESFERTEAVTVIGNLDPVTHRPRFDEYTRLFIEARATPELKPEDAFLFLLKKGVFRAGLKFACPTCQLDSWTALDDAKTQVRCPYCGFDFNVLPQLRDRNWAYRRSGLFGREDNQHGGIPVAVTLMQLETMLHGRLLAYATGMEFNPAAVPIEHCEADLVVLANALPRSDRPIELVLAECKDQGGEITEEDIRKLRKVADALKDSHCSVFLLFAKCGRFTDAEIERCRAGRRRLFEHDGKAHYAYDLIMLSERELEPYYIYEQTTKEFEIKQFAHSFEDLAINTANIYLEPKPKTQNRVPEGEPNPAPER